MFLATVTIILLLIIGRIFVYREYQTMLSINTFIIEFLNKYQHFAFEESERTQEEYDWLLSRVDRIQNHLGIWGIVDYKPPFSNYIVKNYLLVTEVINQLGTTYKPHVDDLISVRHLLFRYISNLDISTEKKKKELLNPLLWFRAGIQFVFSLPLHLLYLFGITEYSKVVQFRNSNIIKIISGVIGFAITVISLVDALLGIIINQGLIGGLIENFLSYLRTVNP